MMDSGWLASISAGGLSAEGRRAWLRDLRNLRWENGLGCTLSALVLVTDELAKRLELEEVVKLSREDWNCGKRRVVVDEVGVMRRIKQLVERNEQSR